MSTDESELGRLATGVDELRDLFRRRLLDDRDKRVLIGQLADRAEAAESRRESVLLLPLLRQLALVVDRMDQSSDALTISCVDELLDAFALQGFETIPTEGHVDPTCHELLEIEGEGSGVPERLAWSELEIIRVLRRGYRFEGRVVRPAQVIARRRPAVDPDLT